MSYELCNFGEYDLVNLVSFRNLLRLVIFVYFMNTHRKIPSLKQRGTWEEKNLLFSRLGLLKPLKSLPPDFRVNQFEDR